MMTAGQPPAPPRGLVELLASDEQFRDALGALPDPVFIFAPRRDTTGLVVDLEYRFVNEAGLQPYGKTVDETVGHGLLELFPSIRDTELWFAYLAVIESGKPASVDLHSFDENGVRGDFVMNVARFGDGIVVTARDVTEQVQVQAQLRHERDFNNAVLDVAGALILVTDDEGRVIRFNRQAELLTGYREAEVVGSRADFLVPPSEQPRVYANLDATSPDHLVSQVNHLLTRQGELRLIRWANTALVDGQGRRTNIISVGIDITELEHAEAEAARRAQELEAANRELARSNADLEQFAYVASHDLAEPLRAISGPIRHVVTHYEGRTLDAKAMKFLGFAVDGSQRMQSMIAGLLMFSRVGRIEGAIEPTDAGQVARQAVEALYSTLTNTQAEVTIEPLPMVLAAPDQLAQVVQNLIGNAVKFVADGVAPRVVIRAEPIGHMWRFDVIDNGIGIAAQDRDAVFTMFKRLNPRSNYAGSGIGLSVVKKIVERHGGDVGVDAGEGGIGSRFWFTLPAAGGADA